MAYKGVSRDSLTPGRLPSASKKEQCPDSHSNRQGVECTRRSSRRATSALVKSCLIARPLATQTRAGSLRAKRRATVESASPRAWMSQFMTHTDSLRGEPTQRCLPPRLCASNCTWPLSDSTVRTLDGLHVELSLPGHGLHVGQTIYGFTSMLREGILTPQSLTPHPSVFQALSGRSRSGRKPPDPRFTRFSNKVRKTSQALPEVRRALE